MPSESDRSSMLSEPLLVAKEDNVTTALQDQRGQHDHELDSSEQQQQQQQQEQQQQRTEVKSKNINRILLYTIFAFSSRSLWNQSVLSAFVYLLKSNDPKFVGILTCIMGLSQLLISFPAGVLADKYRRDTMLKASSIVGLLAVIVTVIATYFKSFVLLGVGLSFWGIYWGISFTSTYALFADSIRDGERSKYFTQRMIIQMLGNSIGPMAALIMFSFIGNEWTMEQCQFVLAVGQLLSIPSFVILCFMNDDDTVKPSSPSSSTSSESDDSNDDDDDLSISSNDLESPLLTTNGASTLSTNANNDIFTEHPDNTIDEQNNEQQEKKYCFIIPESRYIPVMISSADIINGLAAGMSIRYFPIFFLDNLNLTPRIVQVLFLSSTLGMATGGHLTQKLAEIFGRLPITIIVRCIGMSLMVTMVATYQLNAPVWLVCVIWVFRTAIMNTTGALTRSILMDHVIPSERAKWSALESVNFFGWSGSAAFGGYLVDWAGIEVNFYVTASISFLATIPLMALLGKVGKEERTTTQG